MKKPPEDDIVREFLVESYENLDQLDRDFVALEQKPGSRELLAGVFRTIHTIKGTCGFLGFEQLEAVTHAGENVLSLLRDGSLALTPEITTTLLAMVDAVREILSNIEDHGSEGKKTYPDLIGELERLQSLAPKKIVDPKTLSDFAPPALPSAAAPEAAPAPAPDPAPPGARPAASAAARPADPPATATDAKAGPAEGGKPRVRPLQETDVRMFDSFVRSGRLDPMVLAEIEEQQRRGDPRRMGEILVSMGLLQPNEVLEALVAHEEGHEASLAEGSVRVDVGLLDRLVTLVSELVLARNQILQYVSSRDFDALPATSQRLNLITSELQEGIMKTRMQPVANLWNKLPRLVRDVATACGKSVRIEMEGQETEIDKTVLEAIRDPLTHLVRNAVDHGIENREIRLACRKNAEGRVLLRAYHQDGQVCLEISDDGAGLPIERIRRRALDRKLVTPERAAQMTERDWTRLIFTPGFSTADAVTSISGRGVGMDVVKTNLERIGGSVDIQSQGAIGTTVFLRIPLTLAIVPALIVTDDGERYAIPQVSLQELLRIPPNATARGVEWVHEAPVFRLRDRLLPLAFLRELLNDRRPFTPDSLASREGRALHVVVLHLDGRTFGLVVDEVNDAEEIVVKPLVEPLKGVSMLAGATILGDGRVGVILDVPGIARAAGVNAPTDRLSLDLESRGAGARAARLLLVAEARPGWRVGIPLARIARLEEFERAQVERSGDRDVVQYRGAIVPLVRLARLLDPAASEEPWRTAIPAVMLERGEQAVAVAVAGIVDIASEEAEPQPVAGRPGIAAAAVLQGRVVDLLDLDALLEAALAGADLGATGAAA